MTLQEQIESYKALHGEYEAMLKSRTPNVVTMEQKRVELQILRHTIYEQAKPIADKLGFSFYENTACVEMAEFILKYKKITNKD